MKQRLISSFKKSIRFLSSLYVAPRTMEHLKNIRLYELDLVLENLPQGIKILEIGAGAGWQASILFEKGYSISAIDIVDTNYKDQQVFPVVDYDGHNIPFEDKSFDIIFSSNVLEHIFDIEDFQSEIKRVLKDDGQCIHLLPSSNWVFWTNITGILALKKIQKAHGAIVKHSICELYYFSKTYWDKLFQKSGFEVVNYKTNNIFYTGTSFMDNRISIQVRKKLSALLGSSCHFYILKKQ